MFHKYMLQYKAICQKSVRALSGQKQFKEHKLFITFLLSEILLHTYGKVYLYLFFLLRRIKIIKDTLEIPYLFRLYDANNDSLLSTSVVS
jgi:hypothetical protein